MSELVLKNICKEYENGFKAVDNFSLEIKDKEFLIFVGPSGCGKSTTLRMIAGLEEITTGELWIDNQFANYLDSQERELSMVFQSYALYPNMTVYDNIAFSLQVRKLGKQEIDKRVQEVARLLGLEKLLQQRPKDLSGGQRQRVAIGNAIIREPKVLLMDEPLSNLDAKLRGQMRVELAELHKRLGNTIIYVTHDQTEAMTLGTRIVVMKDGIIQQIDAPKNLYENPINLFVAGFIGFPMMNMIKARIMIHEEMAYSQRGRSAYAENEMFYVFEKNRIQVTGYVKEVLLEKDYRGQDVIIGIRPEHISDRPTMNATQRITGEVIGRELLGSEIILYFSILDMQLSARVEATSTAQVGDKMDFFLETDHFCVFDEKTEENLMYH
ncbi:MAG: ABC transporter ATP-binding protein [Lachnospiraceae bacterium]|nr:ABC transporter ATP-binding protein [Lachnospiraceae bacterium]